MKNRLLCGPVLLMVAAPALADPCVSATFDRPFPDATDVETFVSDVASARFPAFWQTGVIDGYRYRIFSNGEGELNTGNRDQNWTISIACTAADQTCDVAAQGDAPADAVQVADAIGQCLLGIEMAQPAPPAPSLPGEPAIDAPIAEAPPTDPSSAPLTDIPPPTRAQSVRSGDTDIACGVAIVDEQTDVGTLQRLLVLLGEDPGPVDGFLGPATFKAMDVFVDNSNWETSITDVIAVLDALHCERSQ